MKEMLRKTAGRIRGRDWNQRIVIIIERALQRSLGPNNNLAADLLGN
jgi:hypothetical protein